jgi:amino acid transporter
MAENKKPLKLFDLVGLGVGGTIGSGIFVVPAVAASMAGPSSLLAWLLCAVSFGAVLACLMWLSKKYAGTGAFYTLFTKAYGEKLSSIIIFSYIVSGVLGIATIASAIGDNVDFFGLPKPVFEIFLVIAFGLLNLLGVALSAWVEDALTIIKIVPLLIIPLLLLPFVKEGNFLPFSPDGNFAFLKSAIVIYWCFTGFELSAIPSKPVNDPERTVPLSLLYVFFAVTLIYLALNFSLIGSVGSAFVASTPAPISSVMEHFYSGAGVIVLVIAVVSMFSALNAYLLGTSLVVESFAGKYIPAFAKESKWQVPVLAVLVCTVVTALLLAFTDYFVFLASASVVCTLIPYIFLCMASFMKFENKWIKLVSVLGIISTLAVLVSSLVIG